jgi:hypothetical protein
MATQSIPKEMATEFVERSRDLKQAKKEHVRAVDDLEMKIVYSPAGPESPLAEPRSAKLGDMKAYSGDYWGTFSLEKFATASSLSYTHEDAWGWLKYLKNFQPENFRYLDENVRIWAYKETYDNWQDTYGMDATLAVYHSGHGGMTSSGKFYAPLGKDWGGQGTTIYSDQMRLGNEQARYIFWSTCYSLRVLNGHNPIRTWDPANLGFRMLFGYETVSYDKPDYGKAFWKHWNKGKSFSTAFMDASWYDISHKQAPSVVACGATQAEAKNRVYNERHFNWGAVSKNWWWWRWYYAAGTPALTRAINQEMPGDLLVARFAPTRVNSRLVANVLRQHDLGISMPREVVANTEGDFLVKDGERRIALESDGSYEIQFAAPNVENLDQISLDKAVSTAWAMLRQHGLPTDDLVLDSIVHVNEAGATTDGDGREEGPFVTETIVQFTQTINGLPVLLPSKGSVSVTVDNDGTVTSLKNSLKEVDELSDRFRSTAQAPDEPTLEDRGFDPKAMLADAWQDRLKETIIRGRMPVAYKVLPETYEIGYSVRDNDGILVARNDIEVDCGSGYFKRYSIEVPLAQ